MAVDLNDYFYFVHVVEKGGFAPAGRALGIPKSRLSRHVCQLEARLEARLIQRTSRQFLVTDAGRTFYEHARAALDRMEAAEAAVRQKSHELAGRVSLSCSVGVAQFALSRILPEFLAQNPRVDVVQHVTNETVDLVENGIDLALRGHMGPLPDSTLIQTKLASIEWHLFASPAYVEAAGNPDSPDALGNLSALKIGWRRETGQWTLNGRGGVSVGIPFRPRFASDDMLSLKRAAAQGLGIVALPAYVCRDEIALGHLVRVLPDWSAGEAQISLLMPSRQGVMPAVEALSAFLRKSLPEAVRP